jgi:hypothetical protein
LRGRNGQGGIRTHDTREGIPVFETGSFSHSDTCPNSGKDKASTVNSERGREMRSKTCPFTVYRSPFTLFLIIAYSRRTA